MYAVVRTLIDQVLMGPTLAPFTTFGLVVLIALSAASILGGSDFTEATED